MDEFNSADGNHGTSIRRILTLCGAIGVIGAAAILRPGVAEVGPVHAQWFGGLKDATTSALRLVSGAVQSQFQTAQPARKKQLIEKDFDRPLSGGHSDAQSDGGAAASAGEHAPSNVTVIVNENDGDDSYSLRIENGKTTAEINGKPVPQDRIRRTGDRVEILGKDGDVLKSFKVAQAPAGGMRLRALTGQGGQFWVAPHAPGQAAVTVQGLDANPPKVMLGITMSEADDDAREGLDLEEGQGIVVDTVKPGLPAAKAGLKEHDVIIAVEGKKGITQEALREVLRSKEPGDTISIKVHRKDDGDKQIKVQLEAFDAAKLGTATGSWYGPGAGGEGQGGPRVWSFSGKPGEVDEAMKEAMKRAEQAQKRALEVYKRHAEGGGGAGAGGHDPEIMLFGQDGEHTAATRAMHDQMKQLQERNAELDKKLAELNARLDKLQKMLDRMSEKRGDNR